MGNVIVYATVSDILDIEIQIIQIDININTIRCLYGKQTIEHLYEYGEQFWKKYKENRKFLSILSNDGHEGTLEVLKYADNVIFNFLNIINREISSPQIYVSFLFIFYLFIFK